MTSPSAPSSTEIETQEGTLQSGSYVVDFQLSAKDTAVIVAAPGMVAHKNQGMGVFINFPEREKLQHSLTNQNQEYLC